ncbi:DUF4082 domain-containing protein [Gillisia sp. M10.2A]|uniref:DUF4082 domain-containing protein n=1 Tax=Gillisia lutea TaxID=2909668 RepID=A0ABS9EHA2_9FLAO|nr:DUF4082 domain-containing protein [Gillisia lutea]MCF4102193.1 DUF4082 domain-containing protein [Gillisia lutea]
MAKALLSNSLVGGVETYSDGLQIKKRTSSTIKFLGVPISASALIFFLLVLSFTNMFSQNEIVIENAKPGNPDSEWQINGSGDSSIQGFATDISYNKGETARFKIKTNASNYNIKIYRLGYYQGNGARYQGDGNITAALPQSQPACITESATGLIDCGNWGESANWQIPTTAVSGIYIAKLTRNDTGDSSHITFIVRDDTSNSDLFFQTSDATWQAYNVYGGNSLYVGSVSGFPSGHAPKVSYNRPFVTRDGGGGGGASEDWIFNAAYPMIRWLESNGYDVTYTTNVDSDRRGNLIQNHKVFLSVGHDEYWSGPHRTNVTEARNAGTHLAFFSGNEVYWKTRWENSIDENGNPYRTLVCYKEGSMGENTCGGKCDPTIEWTGTWRDGCDFTDAGGCSPENSLSGQISWADSESAIQVPDDYKNLRFWRNTSIASLSNGQTATLGDGTLGYEWNPEQEEFQSSYPSGRIILSKTVVDGDVHHLSLYKHESGALVFGAGTVQWSWGLDGDHDRGISAPDQDMQQATVNLFADMGVQPGSLVPDLLPASISTDVDAPIVIISSHADNEIVPSGAAVVITGTAIDENVTAGVEISTNGGVSWAIAEGSSNWTYSWVPNTNGTINLKARAFDDSGNMSQAVTINLTVSGTAPQNCPCTVFKTSDAPSSPLWSDGQGLQLGMKFQSVEDGFVTGIRFYKQSGNTGTHTGQLYSSTGTLLAEVIFTNETASGWQEASFSAPVSVTANTTYVISYHSADGYYSADNPYFNNAVANGPLMGLANGTDGENGVYRYSSNPVFPTQNYDSSNYYVDAIFNTSATTNSSPAISITAPLEGAEFETSTNISIEATASDADGSISKVEFYQGIEKLGEVLSSPYTFTWENATVGTYILTAKAEDDQGAITTSSVVHISIIDPNNSSPTVSISSPSNNASFTAPATINIDVTAADADGSITKVEFYEGTTKLGEDLDTPYTFNWDNVVAGSYSLTAIATDNAGASTTSSAVNITVDSPASICPCTVFKTSDVPSSPLWSDGQGLQLGMKFQSVEDGFVTGIRFYKQSGNTGTHTGQLYSSTGTLLAEVIFTNETASGWQEASFSAPVSVTANTTYVISYHSADGYYSADNPYFNNAVANGPLMGLANGTDGENGVYRYSSNPVFPTQNYDSSNYYVDAIFNTSATTNSSPAISITAPLEGAEFETSTNISIEATASDADGSISKVEFYQGIEKLGEVLSSPYTFTWENATVGTYILTAKAEDDQGAITTSSVVHISIIDPNNSSPTVSISSPSNNASFTAPATINIDVTAADADGSITKVEFYEGTTKLGEDLDTPYTFNWDNVVAGSYSLTAIATDNAGASTTSSAVNITVDSPASICPCTVFKTSDVPSSPLWSDGQGLQLGMKFQSVEDGFVTGIRFYKQSGNTGTHTGQLYSSTGTLLAEVIFTNETASGWQEASFSAPVSVTANTTYVISYHSADGYYSADDSFFNGEVNNSPLIGLANGTDGENGVYRYSSNPVFPNLSYDSSNYYVDVIFETQVVTSIKTASQLEKTTPENAQKAQLGNQDSIQVYPNPFSNITTLAFVLQEGGEYVVSLYDSKGSLISVIQEGKAEAGRQKLVEINGERLTNGIYLVRLQSRNGIQTFRILHIR